MSTDDASVLIPTLFATIAALVVIRLTFRHAATARDALISPAVFAACGGLIGISVGMIWFSNQDGRVVIEDGFRLLMCGSILGVVAGVGARRIYSRLKRGRSAAYILAMMLLVGSIGAPVGWIAGEATAPRAGEWTDAADYDYDLKLWRASRMRWGIAIGSGVGLLVGLSDVVFRRRGAT